MTAHADVCYSNFALGPATYLDRGRLIKVDDVNGLAGTIGHRFYDHETIRVLMQVELKQRNLLARSGVINHIMILSLAQLALESTPYIGVDILG
jgi:hypothetical protein